ncbi:MAG TPA: hypothetical protein VF407_12450 [Polyangiaceae bacterium]
MDNRRVKRSIEREEALQYLMESLADRSEVHAVALVDDDGRIVAGTGMPAELAGLAKIAKDGIRREPSSLFEGATRGTDFFGREITLTDGPMYLAALGRRVRKMSDAAVAIERIVKAA